MTIYISEDKVENELRFSDWEEVFDYAKLKLTKKETGEK